MEEEHGRDIPNIVLFYRPVRQYIYAILFNYHHHAFLAKKAKEEGQRKKYCLIFESFFLD